MGRAADTAWMRRATGLRGVALREFAGLSAAEQRQVMVAKNRLAGLSLGQAEAAAALKISAKEFLAFCRRIQNHPSPER